MTRTAAIVGERSRRWMSAIAKVRATKPPWWLLVLSTLVFTGAAVAAVGEVRSRALQVQLLPLLVTAFVLVPLTVVANGAEFHLQARFTGSNVTGREALTVASFLGSAANNLPVPGAIAVRIGALKQLGVRIVAAGASTAATGLLWASVSAAVAGTIGWWRAGAR